MHTLLLRCLLAASLALLLSACSSFDPGSGETRSYDAQSPAHVHARGEANSRTLAQLQAMLPEGQALGGSRYDACFEYQNNWKIHDPNRYECHLNLSTAVAVANVAEAIRQTGQRFAAAGCPNDTAFADTLGYYVEANGPGSNAPYARDTDLPQVLFDCGDARVQAQFLNPASDGVARALEDVDVMVGARRVALVEQQGYGNAAIAAAVGTNSPLVVLVSIDRRYFAQGW